MMRKENDLEWKLQRVTRAWQLAVTRFHLEKKRAVAAEMRLQLLMVK
jgi:hypothetical protein